MYKHIADLVIFQYKILVFDFLSNMGKMVIVDGKVVSYSFETTSVPSGLKSLCKNAVCVNLDRIVEKMNEERKKEIMKNNNGTSSHSRGSIVTSYDYIELNGVRLTTEEILSGLDYSEQTKCANRMVIKNTAATKSSCVVFSNGNMSVSNNKVTTESDTDTTTDSDADTTTDTESDTESDNDSEAGTTSVAIGKNSAKSVCCVKNSVVKEGGTMNVVCANSVMTHSTINTKDKKKQKITYANLEGRRFEPFVDEQKNRYDIEKIIANLDEDRREIILADSGFRFSSYESPKKPLTITINGVTITNTELQIGRTHA